MHNRKPNRLKEFDYSNPGYYFITICTKNRAALFGEIREAKTELNNYGRAVEQNLKSIERIYNNTELDYYVIMPDHIHLILIINSCINKNENRTKMLLSKIIQQFKRQSTIDLKEIGFNHSCPKRF